MRSRTTTLLAVAILTLLASTAARAYIEAPYALGRVILEATNIVLVKVEKVDNERNLIIYQKLADIKGKHPTPQIKHNIGKGGFNPREWQFIMAYAQPGKVAVVFHNGSASETCIDNYWYQTYPAGEWWTLVHGEPYLLRTYCGKPEKLVPIVQAMLAGQQVTVPCMVDGDKNALQLRTAKMQRMKASMQIQDYDQKRDFAGWGNDEFRKISNMPGFALMGSIGRLESGLGGIAVADMNGDGQADLCLWSENRVLLLQNAGNTFDEVPLNYAGGARGAAWGDWNSDGKIDLLLASPAGLKLFTNEGGKFRDDSALLPQLPYYNLRAAAWMDYDGDGKPDILVANGFLGLRLFRNKGPQPPVPAGAQPSLANLAFEDLSDRVGLGVNGIGSTVKGDGLIVADVNGDGRPDFLYVAGTGVLVFNTPQGFVESRDSGIALQSPRVTPAFGDFLGDRKMHLAIPHPRGLTLLRNDGSGHFADITVNCGEVAKFNENATSVALADFSGKGKLDLFVGCLRGPNHYFRNKGDGSFVDATDEIGLDHHIFNTRMLVARDVNKDGVPDLLMLNEGQDSTALLSASRAPAGPASPAAGQPVAIPGRPAYAPPVSAPPK